MTDTFLYLFDVARESPALEESEGDGPITFKTLDRAGLRAGISNSFLELLLMCFSFFIINRMSGRRHITLRY